MSPRDDATQAQVSAARPDVSTWLAANAGSGKTRVLTDRVARLLLAKVEPQHILCLTYTKAAASEMQNRLFKRLGEWAMLDNQTLVAKLNELGVPGHIDAALLRQARTLFARAIETPGGLKIQTIHSFCASLLRRFPLEAEVSPQFKEIEERAADLLRAEIVDAMAEGDDAALISDLALHYTGEDFGKLTQAIVKHREGFANPLTWDDTLALFDQPGDLSIQDIEASVFLGGEQDLLDQIIPVMQVTGKTDPKLAAKLAAIPVLNFSALPLLESVFLNGSGDSAHQAKVGTTSRPTPTKAARASLKHIEAQLDDFMGRIESARSARLALSAAQKTHALHRFAAKFLPLYAQTKTLRGWLDFDDLIDRARALLNDERVAAWVLFRIDGGIDHILVDEAQDTSPAQWDVIRKLAAEFTSGQGAREENRTIFVVGDKKQSIYSFQGADPREFDRMQSEFDAKYKAVERDFQSRTLKYSFRSSSAILDLVDKTFTGQDEAGFTPDANHIAFKQKLPGRVDLWPLVEKQPNEEPGAWYDPLDRVSAQHHSVILANQIASQIKAMISRGETIPVDGEDGQTKRPVRAGDFLILVQSRQGNSKLFTKIIEACKKHDLPIAGADRLKVGGELAVRDLAALLSFLAVPEDDLALASALRSPLFSWSEQDIFDLAHKRTQTYLWEALRDRKEDFPQTSAMIKDLRDSMDFLRPYDLIERILTRHKGRRHLLARLGKEAEDGINALLSQALAYERNAVPSLTGFLVWMETDDLEIKRQIDSASNQIRVMTVHGAKGLEAPIVILPDTGKRDIKITDDIIKVDATPVWKASADEMPPAMDTAVATMKQAQVEERLRLLYVALTRAEKWLIVAAGGDLSKNNDSWYQLVDAALTQLGAGSVDAYGQTIKRFSHGDWDALPDTPQDEKPEPDVVLDACFLQPAAPWIETGKTVSPSDLGGAKAMAGEAGRDEETAKAYGTLVHHFLEHLSAAPQEKWPIIIESLMPDDSNDSQSALDEARAVLRTPTLAHLFDKNTLSEVAITAQFGTAMLQGIIDRLIVTDESVLAVDFKTNQTVPSTPKGCPEGILRQMGAYAYALEQIYPDRRIDTAIVWTNTCTLMPLPHDIVRDVLQNTPYLDAPASAT
ncbi:MAG: double-strand break repair helicase AddA [Roseobacter sp.]